MAILSAGILGAARNKVGNVVTYKIKGQNVARVYVDKVSNPQSDAQMRQRAKLINLVAAYRANLFWMRYGAFENKEQKWSDYNAFVSANTYLNPPYLTKEQVAAGAGIVQPFTISRGSLGNIDFSYNASADAFISNLFVSNEFTWNDATTTIGQLSEQLITNNNGIHSGDQLSLIIMYQRMQNNSTPVLLVRAFEMIIDTTSQILAIQTIPNLATEVVNGQQCLSITGLESTDLGGAAFILSRDEGGSIKVSTQQLVLTPNMQNYILNYQTDTAFRNFVDSYGGGGENFLSAGYSSLSSNSEVPLELQLQSLTVNQATLLNNAEAPEIQTGTAIRFNMSDTPDTPTEVRFYWFDPVGDDSGSFTKTTGITVLGPTANYTVASGDITADNSPVRLTRAEVVISGQRFGISFQYVGDITG